MARRLTLRRAGVASFAVGAALVFTGCPGGLGAMTHQVDRCGGFCVVTTIDRKYSEVLYQWYYTHLFNECRPSPECAALVTFGQMRDTVCKTEGSSILRATCYDVTDGDEIGDFIDAMNNYGSPAQNRCLAVQIPSTVSPPFNWTVRSDGVDGCTWD
jgi:hypothetical protein